MLILMRIIKEICGINTVEYIQNLHPKKTQQQCFIKGTINIRKLTDSQRQNEKQVL